MGSVSNATIADSISQDLAWPPPFVPVHLRQAVGAIMGNNKDLGRVPQAAPGSREPDPQAVPALPGFDPSRIAVELSGISGRFSRLSLIRAVSPHHLHHTPGRIFGAVDDALRADPLCRCIDLDRWTRGSDRSGDAGETVKQGSTVGESAGPEGIAHD
jgi:hypothetical protein